MTMEPSEWLADRPVLDRPFARPSPPLPSSLLSLPLVSPFVLLFSLIRSFLSLL
jgi:hypothetical protein